MRQSTVSRRSELYREAIAVIERRYGDEDLSLHSVARTIATSRRQLQRAFAEVGLTSFRRELQRVRMRRTNRRKGARTSRPEGVLPGRSTMATGRPVALS